MANATFTTTSRVNAKGREKWYVQLNLEGHRTMRFGGYTEKDAHKTGIRLVADYTQDPAAFFNKSKLKGLGIRAMLEEFLSRAVDDDTNKINRQQMDAIVDGHNVMMVEDIDKYLIQKIKKTMKDAGLADGYVSLRLRVLRAFVNYCLDKSYLKSDPWPTKTEQRASTTPVIPRYRSKGYYYPDAELKTLLTLPVSPRGWMVDLNRAIRVALSQCWRLEQVWALCWERINWDTSTYSLYGMKGAQEREVPLNEATLKVLKEFGTPQGSGRVFTRWQTKGALSHAFTDWHRLCGLTRGRFHDLKHTGVSKLIEAGYTLKQIEEITNTSMVALQHYTHANKAATAAKFKTFAALPAEAAIALKIA